MKTPKTQKQFINMLVIKVGGKDRPACKEDFKDIARQIEICISNGTNPLLITHHAVQFELVKIPCDSGHCLIVGVDDENEFDNVSPIVVK
jgi:hypothetical protein